MNKWLVGVSLFLVLLGLVITAYLNTAQRPAPVPPPSEVVMPPAVPPPEKAPPPPEVKAIEAQKQELELELARARRELTDLRMQAVAEPVEAADTNAAPNAPASFMEALASMMDSPDMQDMIKVQARMGVDQSHGEFLRGMNLSKEEEGELKDLLVQRQLSMMTTGLKMMKGGEGAEGGTNPKDTMDAFNDQIREFLGDEDYKLFERFEETQPERMQVDIFKERLTGDLAMDWETQDRLIEAMANARLAAPASAEIAAVESAGAMPTPEMMESMITHMDGVHDLYLEEAAAILNQEQFAVFEESLEQFSAMQKAGMKMAEVMFGKPAEEDVQE